MTCAGTVSVAVSPGAGEGFVMREFGKLLLLLLLVAAGMGCCTLRVSAIGHFQEGPGFAPHKEQAVCFDETDGVLEIVYLARVAERGFGAPTWEGGLRRKLVIPYRELERLPRCKIEEFDQERFLSFAQSKSFPFDEFVLPRDVWDKTGAEVAKRESAEYLALSDLGAGGANTVVHIVRKGQVCWGYGAFYILRNGEIYYVRLPERKGDRPGARLTRAVLYPFAVVADAATSPLQLGVLFGGYMLMRWCGGGSLFTRKYS